MQIYGFVQTIRTSNSCGLSLDFAMQFATIGGKFSTFLKKNTTSYSGWCIFQSHVLRIVHIYYIYISIKSPPYHELNPHQMFGFYPPVNVYIDVEFTNHFVDQWTGHYGFSMGFPWVFHGLTSCGCRVQGNVAARLQRLPPGCRSCCLPIWNWAGDF